MPYRFTPLRPASAPFAAECESYTVAAKCVSVLIGTFYLVLTVGLRVLGMLEAASSRWTPQLQDRGFSV